MGRKKAIVGSRDFGPLNAIAKAAVDSLIGGFDRSDVLVSGGAPGVDTWAEQAACARGLRVEIFPADWQTHGKAAGPKRNTAIVAASDVVYAVWDGKSRGTKDTIDKARRAGKLGGTAKVLPADAPDDDA